MIRGVCFDMGGTLHLIDNPPAYKLAFAVWLKERLSDYGIELPDEASVLEGVLAHAAERYKLVSDACCKEYNPVAIWHDFFLEKYDIPVRQIAPLAEELCFRYDYCRSHIVRREEIRETFSALKNMGCKTGIISNIISRTVVPQFLADYGIDHLTDCIVTSCESGIRKPDPAIFRIAEERLALSAQELAYVGDTISRDVIGTRNAGWAMMIRIKTPAPSKRDASLKAEEHPADALIEDLYEIPAIIAAYNSR